MIIFVAACDKNEDLFFPFHWCMEKYWPDHPQILYSTESVKNPYYNTICKNYDLDHWTTRLRESLEEISSDVILFMVDDIFLRRPVEDEHKKRIKYAENLFGGNIALVNFEKEWDNGKGNEDVGLAGFKRRTKGNFRISLMCGLWDRKKLIDILEVDSNPWYIENAQNTKGYEYYINSGNLILDWGYKTFKNCSIMSGKWCREIIPFFEKEGIKMDYEKRGFYD